MIPPCSCATPGRKPGTSSKVTTGMLKQSQKRMKRAALSEALISSTPASTAGWLATTPTGRPPSRGKQVKKPLLAPIHGVVPRDARGLVEVVRREVLEQRADRGERGGLGVVHEV